MDTLLQAYAQSVSSAWYLPIALTLLIAACIALGLMSADSRRGFDGRPSSYKERWFIHSRRD
jgi:hypothetical protein